MADKNKVRSINDKPMHKIGVILGTGFFVLLCAIIIFPVFAGLLASFRPGTELIRRGLAINLDISTMSLANYTYLFSGNADSQKYFMWYKNSLIITIVTVVLTLLICYFIAYGLTMYNFKLKNLLFFLVIATMMVPFEILMLPLYKEIIALGLIDTYTGVIITGICNASTIFFFRQYLGGLPKDLLSAGRIDGATEYGIAVKIILPLTKPAFASMGILSAMGTWNAILWPLLVLKGAEKFTLPIGLNTLLTPYGNNYDVLIAGSMFGILPIFIIFLVFQKYIIDGMTAGAVKG
ncbi:MAG: carbohydrate ABC transporter permease [Lachnospiraceae bacterium]|nr:carbohydrate ABC transporter permease [Lachnospiraceae bacterium]